MTEQREEVFRMAKAESAPEKIIGKRHTNGSLRSAFLSALGAIHLIAFWSYYTSFPGLLSSSGLEPVGRLFPYAAPSLYQILQTPENADAFCQLAAVLGIVLACIAVSGYIQHGLLYMLLTVLYSELALVGGTFYSFQWDTLLLETTSLTALCYAPWRHVQTTHDPLVKLGAWPLRFLLFKLMYMSGVVKIQSSCPTWNNLTALGYHFATQCLPGPLAWHAHQLHPLLLRISVAATLWIEIPGAFLLLLPGPFLQFGIALQVLLQLVIILTGNYNFFNLLTICLCVACLNGQSKVVPTNNTNRLLCVTLLIMFVVWSCCRMFSFDIEPMNILLQVSKQDFEELSEQTLPFVIVACQLFVLFKGVRVIMQQTKSPFVGMLHTLICVFAIGVTGIPMTSLTPRLQTTGFLGSQQLFAPFHRYYLGPNRLSNGYGLFRRMTGAGSSSETLGGWAGQPLSVVERPEIILEGVFEGDDDGVWTELSFRWKPGNVHDRPRQVAPHQPRLDWQMWFAALGNAQSNLWFLNLVQKLLNNCRPVQHLVGDPKLLSDRKLLKLRAKLYQYDFTRLDTEWNRGIPNAKLINISTPLDVLRFPTQYWTRQVVRIYLGEIPHDNPDLAKHLARYGYTRLCMEDSCESQLCVFAILVRKHNLHLVPVLLLAMYFVCRQVETLVGRRQRPRESASQTKKNQ